ncbi:transcriptional regulator, partial [Mesorhizobium sp. M1C.F.Ca.ET.187.01.1.1]
GERHRFGAGEAHSQLIESATRRPLPYMQPRGRDGQALQAAATRVRKLKGDGRGA